MSFFRSLQRPLLAGCAWALLAFPVAAPAADFSVSPIRAELKPGAMSETITVTNDSPTRLRVSVKLLAWTQDESGKDVLTESTDLVYFPRQMDVEPGAKRLVRVGAKNPAQGMERAYRLFIEEMPETSAAGAAAVTFYFRFGVPVFVPPAGAKAQPEVGEPTIEKGKLVLPVRNRGTQHFRATRISISDGAGHSQDVAGWYSLPGTSRTYEAQIPRDVCSKAKSLSVRLDAEDGSSFDRTVHVDPARCS